MIKTQVIFKVGRGLYSFDSMNVCSVEAGVDIHPYPGIPGCIEGLAELRGEAVPVCDLHKKLSVEDAYGNDAQVIFVNTDEGCLGCIVDSVLEIGALTEDVEMELPFLIRNDNTAYISKIVRHKESLVTEINQNGILDEPEKEAVAAVMGKVLAERKAKEEAEAARIAAEAEAKKAAEQAEENK